MRIMDFLCVGYWSLSMLGYHLVKAALTRGYWPNLRAFRQGIADGVSYIHSTEYKDLPPVRQIPCGNG